ncbi:MAG: bifunctional metallophosphatase/5'-nucleotidase [Acidobacteria bacterium]|nr:MAG: bifunctional metallophosphatase/5'-nucleotidase [Acidobacteriota bacterium]
MAERGIGIVARFVAVLVAAVCLAGQSSLPQRAWITILSTTDLHGNILPVDYYTDRPDARGLAKVASLVRQIRGENPSGTLLLNSGDTIQGAPLAYVHNTRNNAPPDPMMLTMSAIGVDAMAVGNHEYNFGLGVLEKARSEATFPWLSANTYNTGTGQPHYAPYIVKEMQGVRVGILGLTTPGVPSWDDPKNYAGLQFREPLAEASKWVARLRTEERADLVVIAMHMGLEEDLATGAAFPGQVLNENQALAIARHVEGVDVIVMGHTHREVPALVVNSTLLTQASAWGRHLARADVYLERDGSQRWRVASKQARTIPVTDSTPIDAEIAKLAEPYDRETRTFLNRVIGQSDVELTVESFRDRDTALLDLVHRVQLEAGKADVSMVAVFNQNARVPKGDVRVRDLAGLYVYDNTLVVLDLTGRQLKDALEHSARYFDGGIPDFNYDQAEGVSYELDTRKPVGQRVQNLRFRGKPVGATQTLRLATNNYRVNGGGGYTMYRGAPEVHRSSKEIRELVIEWVEEHKNIPAEPTNNWRMVSKPKS